MLCFASCRILYIARCQAKHEHSNLAQRAYVVYPPEGPRPPSAEELIDRINKKKRQ